MPLQSTFGAASARAWGRKRGVEYIGNRLHGETLDTLIWHEDTREGDIVAVSYLSSRAIVGSTGWTTTTRGMLRLSWKRMTAADLVSSPTFNDVTNMIAQTVRGPRSISAERIGASFDGSTVLLGHFNKSDNCAGFLGVSSAQFDGLSIRQSDAPFIFDADSSAVGPEAFSLYSQVGITLSKYTDGDDLYCFASLNGSSKNASVFEYLF